MDRGNWPDVGGFERTIFGHPNFGWGEHVRGRALGKKNRFSFYGDADHSSATTCTTRSRRAGLELPKDHRERESGRVRRAWFLFVHRARWLDRRQMLGMERTRLLTVGVDGAGSGHIALAILPGTDRCCRRSG